MTNLRSLALLTLLLYCGLVEAWSLKGADLQATDLGTVEELQVKRRLQPPPPPLRPAHAHAFYDGEYYDDEYYDDEYYDDEYYDDEYYDDEDYDDYYYDDYYYDDFNADNEEEKSTGVTKRALRGADIQEEKDLREENPASHQYGGGYQERCVAWNGRGARPSGIVCEEGYNAGVGVGVGVGGVRGVGLGGVGVTEACVAWDGRGVRPSGIVCEERVGLGRGVGVGVGVGGVGVGLGGVGLV